MRRRSPAAGLAVTVFAAMALLAGSTAGASAASSAAHSEHLHQPIAIAAADGKLWIANHSSNSVTVTNSAGAVLKVISAAKDRFNRPDAIAGSGARVWVLSRAGRVTELNAHDGSLVRVIHGARYDLRNPVAIAVHAGRVWVVDRSANAVTEIRASDGALVRVVSSSSAPGLDLDQPVALTFAGTTVWVVSHTGSVSGFDASSGALVHRLHAKRYGLAAPDGIAAAGHKLWITDSATDAVTETSDTGALVQVITNSSNNANYGFDAPTAVVAHGKQVFVISPPGSSPMVTKIETSTAAGDWYECNTNTPDPQFANPTGLTFLGSHIWVVSPANDSLAELHVSTGALIQRFA